MPFVGGPDTRITRWRSAAILKQIEKSPYFGCDLTDFDEICHADAFRPSWQSRPLIFKFKKSKMVAATILKNPKSRYLDNGLTNRHEIWHGNAIRHLWCVPQSELLELCNFENPTCRPPPFWKIEKIAISRPQFQRFQRNLAQWRSSAFVTVWSVTNSRSKEIQDGGGRHPNNLQITISRQRFDRSAQLWHDDAYWPSKPDQQLTFQTFWRPPS